MDNLKELLTVADVSRVVQDLTPAGVRAAADSGRIRVALRTPSGVRLFTRPDAERFARERRQQRARHEAQRVVEASR